MTQPEMVECAISVCRKPTYLHNLVSVVDWERDAQGVLVRTPRRGAWCNLCERARYGKSERAHTIHDEIVVLKGEALKQGWDGETMRTCKRCSEAKPISFFQWKAYSDGKAEGYRVSRCYLCAMAARVGERSAKKAERRRTVPPFDLACQAIVQRTGVPYVKWDRRLHNAQTILMRELAGFPHSHISGQKLLDAPEEARWRETAQALRQWAGV